MSLFIIIILAIFVVSFFLFSALILFKLSKLFKIENATYKNSMIILLFYGVVNFLISGFLTGLEMEAVIDPSFLFVLIIELTAFFAFYYFFKKYYQSSLKKTLGIYIGFSIISFVLVLIIIMSIRAYIAEPFIVSGKSMNPIYNDGDYLLIDKLSNKFDRSDVIVARNPKEQNQFIIKRVIALPNEKVEIKNGDIFINGKILNEEYIINKIDDDLSITLNGNQYFVLSDNRNESSDSRFFGPVPVDNIEGEVFYKIPIFTK